MRDRKLEALFLRFRSTGDLRALGEVFDSVSPEMLRIARHLVHDEAAAEDAVQTAFLVAVEKPEQYDAQRAFVPWLIGILVRRAYELRREHGRRPEPERLAQRATPDPHAELEARELYALLDRTLDELPDTYASALRPHLAEGIGATEIAARLGISANSVSVRLHRGLKLLRHALPAGIAATAGSSAASASLAGGGLAMVREEVLGAAGGRTSLISGAPSVTILAGTLLTKKAIVAVAAAVLLLAGLWASRSGIARELESPNKAPASSDREPEASKAELPESVAVQSVDSERTEAGGALATQPWEFFVSVVDLEDSTPIRNARVGEWTRDGLRELARTDAKGVARFTAAPELGERLYVAADGYAPYRTPREEAARERAWREHCISRSAADHRFSFASLHLERGARVAGRVVGEDGAFVGGAELFLFDERWGYPRAVTDECLGLSGSDGWFRLSDRVAWTRGETATNYLLVALHEDGLGFARFPALGGQQVIDDLEVVLRKCADFEVLVRTEDGAPLPNVLVRCVPRFGPWDGKVELFGEIFQSQAFPPRWRANVEQKTDADGRARFATLPTVPMTRGSVRVGTDWKPLLTYQLEFRAPGWRIKPKSYVLPYEDERVLHVTARERRELRVRGRVLGPDGQPIEGAGVLAADVPDAVSDAKGRFEWAAVPVELFPLKIQAMANGFSTAGVELPAGARDSCSVELRLGRALGITGRVVDANGRPADGVRVYAHRDGLQLGGVPTDFAGFFDISNAGEGEWSLRVLDKGRGPLLEAGASGGARGVELVVPVRSVAVGRALVNITEATTGRPLDPLKASLHALDPRAQAAERPRVERSAERVELSELAPGWWALEVGGPDKYHGKIAFEITADERILVLELSLAPRVDLVGRVDFGALPIPDQAQIKLTEDLERLAGRPVPDDVSRARFYLWVQADGSFTVGGLEPGLWRAELLGEGVGSDPLFFDSRLLDGAELQVRARPIEGTQ